MEISFSKEAILKGALGQYDQYCSGYSGKGNYLTALIMSSGVFKKNFSHPGSKVLDGIIAYDKAETKEAYIGQINMSFVSSFCGPEGLIWGYDLAEKKELPAPISKEATEELKEITIKNGENLRIAAKALLGTNEEKHFPFLPGSHVPCAGRIYKKEGPALLYGCVSIGIPENREKEGCLIMEDVGKIVTSENINNFKEKLMLDSIKSIIEVGKNQNIKYKEIFTDLVFRKIEPDEIGCILVVMPYFLLARKAFTEKLTGQKLEEWIKDIFK